MTKPALSLRPGERRPPAARRSSSSYVVDLDRYVDEDAPDATGVFIRAYDSARGGYRAADIAELELESLVRWCTLAGEENEDPHFALRTLAVVLGHERDEVDEALELSCVFLRCRVGGSMGPTGRR